MNFPIVTNHHRNSCTSANGSYQHTLLYNNSDDDDLNISNHDTRSTYQNINDDDDDENDNVVLSTSPSFVKLTIPMTTHCQLSISPNRQYEEESMMMLLHNSNGSPDQYQNHPHHHGMYDPMTSILQNSNNNHNKKNISNLYIPSITTTTITSEVPKQSSTSYIIDPHLQQQQQPSEAILPVNIIETNGTSSSSLRNNEQVSPKHPKYHQVFTDILYGFINAIIIIPVIVSFAMIIYHDSIFQNYIPILVSCTLCSSILHQMIFTSCSSLSCAIGQVQDAGLIFLSTMAHKIVVHYTNTNYSTTNNNENENDTIHILLSTTMFALSLSTILLGCSLVIIGQYQLAHYIQYLPTCIIGGYLAYIGYFCGYAGYHIMIQSIPSTTISMIPDMTTMTDSSNNTNITTITSIVPWYISLIYTLPGIIGGIWIYGSIRTFQHMMTLPICIGIELILFYCILYCTNTSIYDATQYGWIRSNTSSSTSTSTSDSSSFVWYHTWDYIYMFHSIDYSVLPSLLPNLIGMIFVVALSSSLDISAIELELQQQRQQQQKKSHNLQQTNHDDTNPKQIRTSSSHTSILNYNHEIQMIGYSNILSGCCGGYTGSYIFSQSIFNLRAGIQSRITGIVIILCEVCIFILPIPILSYIPNFIFASLLCMICIDLMMEWLYDVQYRLSRIEYSICIVTFLSIILTNNVEYGILIGIAIYMLGVHYGYIISHHIPNHSSRRNSSCSNNTTEYNGHMNGIHHHTDEDENESLSDLLLQESIKNEQQQQHAALGHIDQVLPPPHTTTSSTTTTTKVYHHNHIGSNDDIRIPSVTTTSLLSSSVSSNSLSQYGSISMHLDI